MADTHSEIITTRASNIAKLSADAEDKISNDILSLAAQEMEERLGDQEYGNYVRMFTENVYDQDDAYHELADGEKKLRNLETAEAYYVLYFLALAMKEMKDSIGFADRVTFGEGAINPVNIDNLINMKDQYRRSANRLVSRYASGGVVVTAI